MHTWKFILCGIIAGFISKGVCWGRVRMNMEQEMDNSMVPVENSKIVVNSTEFTDLQNKSIERLQALEDTQKQIQMDLRQITIHLNALVEQQKELKSDLHQIKSEIMTLKQNQIEISMPTSKEQDVAPITGVFYEIKVGDSLATIAKKLNSRTEYIRKANAIVDPRDLRVGDKIFVPQKNN